MHLVRRIPCVDEAGRQYTVVVYARVLRSPLLSEEGWRTMRGSNCFLSTGEDVHMADENTFQVIQRDLVLKRSGPDQCP